MAVVLGLHGGFTIGQHEPGACLMVDGVVKGIYEEERFNRVKSSFGLLPKYSLISLLNDFHLDITDIDLVVVPGITYEDTADRWSIYLKHLFSHSPEIHVCHHQEAHAAAAFAGSNFSSAAAVTLDAYGDGLSGAIYKCSQPGVLKLVKEYDASISVGTTYTALTYHLGFEEGDEYKVMGLASYGKSDAKDIDCYSPEVSSQVLRKHPKSSLSI